MDYCFSRRLWNEFEKNDLMNQTRSGGCVGKGLTIMLPSQIELLSYIYILFTCNHFNQNKNCKPCMCYKYCFLTGDKFTYVYWNIHQHNQKLKICVIHINYIIILILSIFQNECLCWRDNHKLSKIILNYGHSKAIRNVRKRKNAQPIGHQNNTIFFLITKLNILFCKIEKKYPYTNKLYKFKKIYVSFFSFLKSSGELKIKSVFFIDI